MRAEYTKLIGSKLRAIASHTYTEALVIAKSCRKAEQVEDEDQDGKRYPEQTCQHKPVSAKTRIHLAWLLVT